MIDQTEHINNLIVHAYGREVEVYSYQTNIDNYMQMLSTLPTDDIPNRLAQYMLVDVVNLPFDMSDDDIQLISDYQYRDKLRMLLRTEKVEQSKAKRVLDALKMQIGPDADAQIAAYKASLITS